MPRALILASASPRRRALLEELGVAFEVVPSDVEETIVDVRSPEATATLLAERKALAIARRRPDALVLGADTLVVAATGELLGKPVDADDARRMLRLHSGSTQTVVTGVALVGPGVAERAAVSTRVTMRGLSRAEIDAYVASDEPFGKAGAYAIQEQGDRFVTRVEGSWSNVVGLPIERVREMLVHAGVRVPAAR